VIRDASERKLGAEIISSSANEDLAVIKGNPIFGGQTN
jgi:hypothetical protein